MPERLCQVKIPAVKRVMAAGVPGKLFKPDPLLPLPPIGIYIGPFYLIGGSSRAPEETLREFNYLNTPSFLNLLAMRKVRK